MVEPVTARLPSGNELWGEIGEYGVLVAAVGVAIVIVMRSPLVRSHGDATEAEMRAVASGANVDKQFKRPPDEGGLL